MNVARAPLLRASAPGTFARVASLFALVIVEYLVAAVRFDGGALKSRGGWVSHLSDVGEGMTAFVIALTAGVLLSTAALKRGLEEVSANREPIRWSWGTLHLASYGAALWAASLVFGPAPLSSGRAGALTLLAGVAEVFSLAALLRTLFGRGAFGLLRALARVAMLGLLPGAGAWFAGLELRAFWPILARGTLTASAWLLRSFGAAVRVDIAGLSLGLGEFEVEVQSACSGVEGMALVGVLLAIFVLRFRDSLRLGRAFALVAFAVALAWLANVARIAALVALGASGHPDVAFGGFHSKAGWVLFCAISLSAVALLKHASWFAKPGTALAEDESVENPTAPYCLPFLAFLAASLVTGSFAAELDLLYPLHALAALTALAWTRRERPRLRLAVPWEGVGVGLAVGAVWLVCSGSDAERQRVLASALGGLPETLRVFWLAVRCASMVVLVPLIEELAFRGFLQRRLVQADFAELPYANISGWGVVGSALAFGALHSSVWLGGLAGLAYSWLSRRAGKLEPAIWAHATTNAVLAAVALTHGRLDLLS